MGYLPFLPGYSRSINVETYILDLGSQNSVTRMKARHALIHLGNAAVPSLIVALRSRNELARWEAAKALEEVRSPAAAQALIQALQDSDPGVRWLAGDALIALHQDAIEPILQGLKDHFDSIWLREGALHVLHGLQKKNLLSKSLLRVMVALSGPEPEVVVPWEAYLASQKMTLGRLM